MMQHIPALTKFEEVQQIEARLNRDAQPGDILLFYHAEGINRVIPLVTRSPFFHVALYAGDMEVIEARPVGVIRRSLHDLDDIHDFVIIPALGGAGQVALNWALTQIGAGYDRADVLVLLFDRIFKHLHINYTPSDKWTCGEFVATAFDYAGERLLPNIDLEDVEPGDFGRFVPPSEMPETSAQLTLQNITFAAYLCFALVGVIFLTRSIFRLARTRAKPLPTAGPDALHYDQVP